MAQKYLNKYNYLPTRSDNMIAAITRFQQFMHLPVTGKLDAATSAEMKKPRCGNADVDIWGKRVKRYDISSNTKWLNKPQINYYVQYGPDLSASTQNKVFARAFKFWSDVSSLTFYQVYKPEWADIKISFGTGAHDGTSVESICDTPFDGKGGVLAHAYYPEDGRAHFDDTETYTDETDEGTNLLYIAVHELGHSLGLGHSDVKGTIMWPSYRGYRPNLQLHEDDIAGIQALYGRGSSGGNSGGSSGGNTGGSCKDKYSKCSEWLQVYTCDEATVKHHCPKSCNAC